MHFVRKTEIESFKISRVDLNWKGLGKRTLIRQNHNSLKATSREGKSSPFEIIADMFSDSDKSDFISK